LESCQGGAKGDGGGVSRSECKKFCPSQKTATKRKETYFLQNINGPQQAPENEKRGMSGPGQEEPLSEANWNRFERHRNVFRYIEGGREGVA